MEFSDELRPGQPDKWWLAVIPDLSAMTHQYLPLMSAIKIPARSRDIICPYRPRRVPGAFLNYELKEFEPRVRLLITKGE